MKKKHVTGIMAKVRRSLISFCVIIVISAPLFAVQYKMSDNSEANDFFIKGLNFNNSGKYSEAIPLFQKAIVSDNKFAYAYFELAFAYQQAGKEGEALANYESGIALEPQFMQAYVQIAVLYAKNKDIMKSYEYLKKGNELFPEDATISKMLKATEEKYGMALNIAEQAKKDGSHVVVGQVGKAVYVGPQYYKKGEVPITPVEQKLFDEYMRRVNNFRENNVPDNVAKVEMKKWYLEMFEKYNTNPENFNYMLSKVAYGEIPPDSYTPPVEQ
jgi:tetratricopeptide (TPR) repeat protein